MKKGKKEEKSNHGTFFRKFENSVAPWSKYHTHLSAGGFMSTLKGLEKFLFLWLMDHAIQYDRAERNKTDGRLIQFGWDDQLALRGLHMQHHPAIKVDTLSKIFTRRDDRRFEL